MSSEREISISAVRLGKRYRIRRAMRRSDTLRDAIVERFSTLRRGGGPPAVENVWALRDASFAIARGDIVGVVGRNGAGKSTLLKLLSRITEPTEGRARLRGRVASLLEVGVGFHPELTGRENVFLNGAILGMKQTEIARRFDEIVAFSEVETYIDTPVKHYSSGMYVRLAFGVAAHLEPEILLVDEVLAVGDAGFQKKCIGKMREVGRSGRTVLFVSHNLAAVSGLCRHALLVDGGRLVAEGPAPDIVRTYLGSFGGEDATSLEHRTDRFGDGRLRVTHVRVADADGRPANALRSGEAGQIILRYRSTPPERLRNVLVNLYLLSPWGEKLCEFQTDFVGSNFDEIPLCGEFVCRIPRVPLQAGSYPFTFRVYSSERMELDEVQHAGEISVEAGDYYGSGRIPPDGALFMDHEWQYRAV